MHEARIKYGGQFTYEIKKIIEIRNEVITINPELLLYKIEDSLNNLIKKWTADPISAKKFSDLIMDDFTVEIQFMEDKLKCRNPDCMEGQDQSTDENCIYCKGTGIDQNRTYEKEVEKADDAAYFSAEEDK